MWVDSIYTIIDLILPLIRVGRAATYLSVILYARGVFQFFVLPGAEQSWFEYC